MNKKNLKEFYDVLEDLATYNYMHIEEDDFLHNIKILKKFYKEANLEIPNEIKMTKSSYDFRSEMQKVGGYKDRRERLKTFIYPLMDFLEELNNFIKSNNYEIETMYGPVKNISLTSKSGGNGIVYFGVLNKTDVAVKFLLNSKLKKKKRFLCEFINVIMAIDNYEGIVKQYFYE